VSKKGTYYAGRVLKLGVLDQHLLLEAIRHPKAVRHRGNAWTFIDVEEHQTENEHFVFGRLSKYAPDGQVGVVDETTRSEKRQVEPNLLVASSPFVYIPEHSGIAFLNVVGQIDVKRFIRRFCEIVRATHDGFFVDCDIEPVTDLETFAAKLRSLEGIFKIDVRISPPNPLFSPLWESLEQYLRGRNTDRMTIVEDAPEAGTLKTQLPDLVDLASRQTAEDQFIPENAIPIGDAAILMAADGYGNGVIRGRRGEEVVVIKTSETALHFAFDKVPVPYELYLKALDVFRQIKRHRHMEHKR
jgi:hypothetical protein